MQEQIRCAFAIDGPVLIDVHCPGWTHYEPRLERWDASIEECIPSLPEDEFRAQMKYVGPMPGWEKRRG